MDRRDFLHRFGLGLGAAILTPKIIKANLLDLKDPENKVKAELPQLRWDESEIFIRVINTSKDIVPVMLFGARTDFSGKNILPDGVKVLVKGSTMEQINMEIWNRPLRIHGFNLRTNNQMQFAHGIELYRERKSGMLESSVFHPFYDASRINKEGHEDFTIMDAPGFELLLTPEVYIIVKVNPGEQVDYVFSLAHGPIHTLRSNGEFQQDHSHIINKKWGEL